MSVVKDGFSGVAPEKEKFPFIVVAERQDGGEDIEIRNVTVKTPGDNGRTLVRDINLTLKKGSRIVLTGASGSGKTLTAKALLNQWDYGSGAIIMPKGIKIMSMSQQAYFANTTMRGMLNITPEDKARFDDEQLTQALKAVGLGNLVQHIPGQQVKIMMKDLLKKIPETLNGYEGKTFSSDQVEKIHAGIAPVIQDLVAEQFTAVQHVPEKQRDYMRLHLKDVLSQRFGSVGDDELTNLTDRLCADIDMALAQPLVKHLSRVVPEWAEKKRGKIFAYSPEKASYFAWSFERNFAKRIANYMANKDTDDMSREIRINKAQADFVVRQVTAKLREEFGAHSKTEGLTLAFNAATWPASLVTVNAKARNVAGALMQRATFFMDRQIPRGETLTLSGGERQKLIIAMVLLHKPDILILDEITAALDPKTGAALYKDMLDQIPAGTTLLSIAHNEYIKDCHTHHAHLENQTITMQEIRAQEKKPALCPSCPHIPNS